MLVQRTRHTRAYVQIPNEIAQRSDMSLEALGLLVKMLSYPDRNSMTLEKIAARVPNGRRTISNAANELTDLRYYHRARVQDPETKQWVTLTSVSDTPTDRMPTVGESTPRAVGSSPKGEKNPKGNDLPPTSVQQAEAIEGEGEQEGEESPQKNDPKTPGTADAVTGRAVACLGRLGRVEPSLKLSMRESMRLAPLAAQWLSEGLAEVDVIKALTRALPTSVDSAAALVSYRLKNHQPEKAAPLLLTPSPAPVKREQCPECHRPFPVGHPGGICRDCR
ncbi:helix-turn-helix DNA binding domain protein [Streptomyces phage Success]|uniref:Helix-turn-helix DNA binding domain protein n=1 Tax=Streptomyces phage Success TaxID=2999013 RepID=A0A9E8M5G3_9CAUD|nr:helix-turn-helix DNA binding domain protein [Streptomyces phage Success]WAB08796.1 helix-turn-helix DNA binding domain protein [Streptomyces phage Success]